MQCRRLVRQVHFQAGAVGKGAEAVADRFHHAGRSLAGGGRQANHRGRCVGRLRGLHQQPDEAQHGVGLARARAAGDDGEAVSQRHGGSDGLPVRLAVGDPAVVEEAAVRAQRRGIDGFVGAGQQVAQSLGQPILVAPVALRVQAVAVEDERGPAAGLPHQWAVAQCLPERLGVAERRLAGNGGAFCRQRQAAVAVGDGTYRESHGQGDGVGGTVAQRPVGDGEIEGGDAVLGQGLAEVCE